MSHPRSLLPPSRVRDPGRMNTPFSSAPPASASSPTPRRPRRNASLWQPVINALDAPGLSVAAFCAREGLPAASVYRWRRKLAAGPNPPVEPAARADPIAPPRVVRLDLPAAPPAPGVFSADTITAKLTNGVRLTANGLLPNPVPVDMRFSIGHTGQETPHVQAPET